jgi:hypothetical protein
MNSTAQFNTISELDLGPTRVKLMDKDFGEGWTREQVDAAEFEYRRFLYLVKLFPHEQTAPLLDVDIFWHYHILDTRKYAADCEKIFGCFLHHSPYSGLRGEDDEAVHHRGEARMQELYKATFGEACIRQKEGHAVPASSPEVTVQTAWCQGAITAQTAGRHGTVTAKTAWCQGTATAKTAWCQGVITAQTAGRHGTVTAKTAWCQGTATAKTAWCQGSVRAWPQTIAQNNNCYSVGPELAQAA